MTAADAKRHLALVRERKAAASDLEEADALEETLPKLATASEAARDAVAEIETRHRAELKPLRDKWQAATMAHKTAKESVRRLRNDARAVLSRHKPAAWRERFDALSNAACKLETKLREERGKLAQAEAITERLANPSEASKSFPGIANGSSADELLKKLESLPTIDVLACNVKFLESELADARQALAAHEATALDWRCCEFD